MQVMKTISILGHFRPGPGFGGSLSLPASQVDRGSRSHSPAAALAPSSGLPAVRLLL